MDKDWTLETKKWVIENKSKWIKPQQLVCLLKQSQVSRDELIAIVANLFESGEFELQFLLNMNNVEYGPYILEEMPEKLTDIHGIEFETDDGECLPVLVLLEK